MYVSLVFSESHYITGDQAVTIFVAMEGEKIGQLQRKSPILYPVFGK